MIGPISLTDKILCTIGLKSCFTATIFEQELNQNVDTNDCEGNRRYEGFLAERRKAPFTIYSWTIRIMLSLKMYDRIMLAHSS